MPPCILWQQHFANSLMVCIATVICAEVPQGAHGGEGPGRSGTGSSGEPGRIVSGAETEEAVGFLIPKNGIHTYKDIYIYILVYCIILYNTILYYIIWDWTLCDVISFCIITYNVLSFNVISYHMILYEIIVMSDCFGHTKWSWEVGSIGE